MLGAVAVPVYRDYANDILTSGRHLLAVISDILDFAQLDAGGVELADDEAVDLPALRSGSCAC